MNGSKINYLNGLIKLFKDLIVSNFINMYTLSNRNLTLSLLGLGGLTLIGLLTMKRCPYFWKNNKNIAKNNEKVETS